MAGQSKLQIDPGASVVTRVEQIRGGTRIHMTTLIVAGALIALAIIAICVVLAFNSELAKARGDQLLQALLYFVFTLVGILGGSRLKQGE